MAIVRPNIYTSGFVPDPNVAESRRRNQKQLDNIERIARAGSVAFLRDNAIKNAIYSQKQAAADLLKREEETKRLNLLMGGPAGSAEREEFSAELEREDARAAQARHAPSQTYMPAERAVPPGLLGEEFLAPTLGEMRGTASPAEWEAVAAVEALRSQGMGVNPGTFGYEPDPRQYAAEQQAVRDQLAALAGVAAPSGRQIEIPDMTRGQADHQMGRRTAAMAPRPVAMRDDVSVRTGAESQGNEMRMRAIAEAIRRDEAAAQVVEAQRLAEIDPLDPDGAEQTARRRQQRQAAEKRRQIKLRNELIAKDEADALLRQRYENAAGRAARRTGY